MGNWNWLDWVLASIVVISVLTAFLKGFVRELISLTAVVVGLIVGAWQYKRAALWFVDLTRSYEVALGLGFLALFLTVLLLGSLVSLLAKRLIKGSGLQGVDRLLGAVFGLARGLIVACIILLVLTAFSLKPVAVQRSVLAPYIMTGTTMLASAMPEELKAQFRISLHKFRQAVTQADQKRLRD